MICLSTRKIRVFYLFFFFFLKKVNKGYKLVLALLHSESQKKQEQNGYFLCMKEKRNYLECFFYFFFYFVTFQNVNKTNNGSSSSSFLWLLGYVQSSTNNRKPTSRFSFLSLTIKFRLKILSFPTKKFFFSHLVFLLSLFSFFDLGSPIQLSFIMRGMCQRLY